MRRRARRSRPGAPRAYAATATGPQRLRDRRRPATRAALRLRDVELAVDSADVSGRRARLAVRSLYGIRGVRGTLRRRARRVTAVRTAAGWRVRSESSRRERHPWEVGPYAERRSRHFVVLAPRGLDIDAAGLTAALESGYARMGERAARGRGCAGATSSSSPAARPRRARSPTRIRGVERPRGAHGHRGPRGRAPRGGSTAVPRSGCSSSGRRSARSTPTGAGAIVTHELTHAALAGVTSGRTPAWLLEGMALYVSDDRRVGEAGASSLAARGDRRARGAALTLAGLSRPDAIARLDGDAPGGGLRLRVGGGVLHRRPLRPQALLAPLRRLQPRGPARPGRATALDRPRACRRTLGVSLRRASSATCALWIRTQSF